MKYCVKLLALAGFGLFFVEVSAQTFGQETGFQRQLRERDDQPIREFVESKENIDIQQKAKHLEISGDIRFEWHSYQEKGVALMEESSSGRSDASDTSSNNFLPIRKTYRGLRGGQYVDADNLRISHNDFDIEFNLKLKYSLKDAWAMAHLQFDNPGGIRTRLPCKGTFPVFNSSGDQVEEMVPLSLKQSGKGSGAANSVNLKRAYAGYNILSRNKERLDVEIGRKKMDDIFISEIEFSSRFDGILLKYTNAWDGVGSFYCNAGVFLIDERVNQFGWAAEVGGANLYDIPLTLRYSFIDWKQPGETRCLVKHPLGLDFQNSQISFDYVVDTKIGSITQPFDYYGGFLINHAARSNHICPAKKNLGWYAGLYIGDVKHKGDWATDIEYVVVQAQAVPDFDVGSIGRGNLLDQGLYDSVSVSSNEVFLGCGNANFKGWHLEILYALTDNLTLDCTYECSRQADRKIGGPHRYKSFEIETIYAF